MATTRNSREEKERRNPWSCSSVLLRHGLCILFFSQAFIFIQMNLQAFENGSDDLKINAGKNAMMRGTTFAGSKQLKTTKVKALESICGSFCLENTKNETSDKNQNQFLLPRFLFGIFTTANEVDERKSVRETWINFYKDMENEHSTRICSLADILEEKVDIIDCQIAYVFVVGGLDSGPTEHLAPNETVPITIAPPRKLQQYKDEKDLVFLNIQENMNEGKTPTFFHFATIIVEQFRNMGDGITFDYITKMDSDTMLFVPHFITFAKENLGLPSRLTYAGYLINGYKMQGNMYILSPDIAKAISSPDYPRPNLPAEDRDIATRIQGISADVKKVNFGKHRYMIQPSMTRARGLSPPQPHRNRSYDFSNIILGHNEWGQYRYTSGPYFKHLPTFRKIWRHFLFWYSNSKKRIDNIFHLYDMPAISGNNLLVRTNDYIYSKQDFDSSPIVMKNRKLIFFPIVGNGDTTWRLLFRRMMGFEKWNDKNRQSIGLRYLSDYSPETASMMMTSPEYTRAIFVRDPKVRVLSAFVNKVVKSPQGRFMRRTCCGSHKTLRQPGSEWHFHSCAHTNDTVPFDLFVELIQECDQPDWRPQSRRMEPKYYRYINFVGHFENIQSDAMLLLKKIGVWEKFGANGWGENGDESIFQSSGVLDSILEPLFDEYYNPTLERAVEDFYRIDYETPTLNLKMNKGHDRDDKE